jgi:hypothetical protein
MLIGLPYGAIPGVPGSDAEDDATCAKTGS